MFKDLRQYGKPVGHPTLGVMCHFAYDAKLKDTLPLWDRYPLVIPADFQDSEHFLGYNLHYVPYGTRKVILDTLFKYTTYQPRARFQASYSFLKGIGMLDIIKPCIKSYLYSHVQTRYLEINPVHWYTVCNIPSAQWQKGKPYSRAR